MTPSFWPSKYGVAVFNTFLVMIGGIIPWVSHPCCSIAR